jgi:Pentapeptide repeats (8 copies)
MGIEKFTTPNGTYRVTRILDRQGEALFESNVHCVEPWISGTDCLQKAARTGANLPGADLSGDVFAEAKLGGLKAPGADCTNANFTNAKLGNADLSGATFGGAVLDMAYLASANLRRADFKGATIGSTKLPGADLTEADLSGVRLSGVSLADATLDRAKLAGADLPGADLTGASLAGIDWTGVDVAQANWAAAREQMHALLTGYALPSEPVVLLDALRKGIVNADRTILGTLAGWRKQPLPVDPLKFHAIERMCTGIAKDDTSETNPLSALLVTWIEEWQASAAAHAAHDLCPICGQARPRQAAA